MSEEATLTKQEEIITYRQELYKDEYVFARFNKVWLIGILEDEFEYSHTKSGIRFYKNKVRILRWNIEKSDSIPIMVAESNIPKDAVKDKCVEIGGYFYSFSEIGEDNKSHLKLYVLCRKMYINKNDLQEIQMENAIYLEGEISQDPNYRKTPKSNKDITELMVTVKRGKKKDLIPCIIWGEDAQYARYLNAKDRIKVYGRIQSRFHLKKDDVEIHEVYEVSITKIDKIL